MPDAAVEHARAALAAPEPLFLLLARHKPDYRDMQSPDPRVGAIVRALATLPLLADLD